MKKLLFVAMPERAKKILLTGILVIFSVPLFAASEKIGGYVDHAEHRFVNNVWNFVKNFQNWTNVGGNQWKEIQYFWAEPFEFTTSSSSFINSMDLDYVSGHGAPYFIQTNQATSAGVDFRSASGYGANSGGPLKFLIIESCNTVTTAPDVAGDWWTPWTAIFHGLHQLVGFHTLSNSDNGIPNNYANKLRGRAGIWQAWFEAVDDERYWIFNPTNSDGSAYPGYASAVMYNSTANDTLSSFAPTPASGANDMTTWWQY